MLLSLGYTLANPPPPEPEGYKLDNYRTSTPATLAGAVVVTTEQAERLWRAGAVFIDLMPRAPRPANLPAGTLWRTAPHESIPGALWLVNTGYGELAPETESYFSTRLNAAVSARPDRPLVFFCLRDCWMSWNGAKRALAMRYKSVHWYPDGTDGWREAGLPLVVIEPAD